MSAPSHPSKKQAKVAPSQKPAASNPTASTPNTAKQQPQQQQQQPKHKSDKSAAEGAAAGSKKADKAALGTVADADGAPLSKSQLKKQRKKAQGNEEAAATADTPGDALYHARRTESVCGISKSSPH